MHNNLKEKRVKRGLTQEELSKRSGISRTIISKIENNETISLNTKTMECLADALNCSIRSIFIL